MAIAAALLAGGARAQADDSAATGAGDMPAFAMLGRVTDVSMVSLEGDVTIIEVDPFVRSPDQPTVPPLGDYASMRFELHGHYWWESSHRPLGLYAKVEAGGEAGELHDSGWAIGRPEVGGLVGATPGGVPVVISFGVAFPSMVGDEAAARSDTPAPLVYSAEGATVRGAVSVGYRRGPAFGRADVAVDSKADSEDNIYRLSLGVGVDVPYVAIGTEIAAAVPGVMRSGREWVLATALSCRYRELGRVQPWAAVVMYAVRDQRDLWPPSVLFGASYALLD